MDNRENMYVALQSTQACIQHLKKWTTLKLFSAAMITTTTFGDTTMVSISTMEEKQAMEDTARKLACKEELEF